MLKKKFGLLGKNISYSFSKGYFTEKFKKEIYQSYTYENFDIPQIDLFLELLKDNKDFIGLNVTIPYKQTIITYLDKIDKTASKIGAVNVIKVSSRGKTKGYNTDYYGFKKSLKPLLRFYHKKALILGTGGASKAVAYALKELGIKYKFVSRNKTEDNFVYEELNEKIFNEYKIIINCTPVGTRPEVEKCPSLPYNLFTSQHLAYDLVYNPEETMFMKKAKESGAVTKNGLDMLVLQAEKAWKIWMK